MSGKFYDDDVTDPNEPEIPGGDPEPEPPKDYHSPPF